MNKKALLPLSLCAMLVSVSACFGTAKNSESNIFVTSSESSSIEESSSESSKKESEPYKPNSVSQVYMSENYTLSEEQGTCENHEYEDEIIRKATIIQKGIVRHACKKCGGFAEEFFYDLNECAFENKSFMYDGKEHELFIEGMLPYGCTVKYENNKLTDKGEKEATAFIYNEENKLIDTKKAKINIIENTGLPSLKITTSTNRDPSSTDRKNYTQMTASTENCDSKYIINDVAGGIRVRGNSTSYDGVPKLPWRLKFDSKVNLLGVHGGQKFKSWVLLADYFDQSLLRNASAFYIGNSLFNYSNNYSSGFQHVNFYMNGNYRGIYLLAEQQQANKNRINVLEPEETDSYAKDEKVGYLIEIDQRGGDDDKYFSVEPERYSSTPTTRNLIAQPKNRWNPGGWGDNSGIDVNGVRVKKHQYAIKTDTFDNKQVQYIEKYFKNSFNSMLNIVLGGKLQILDENNNLIESPYNNQYDTINSFIDLDSMFKMCVLSEYMKNFDVGFGSFYMYIDFSANSKYPRLAFGAPWDFDLSSGNKTSGDNSKSNNEYIRAGYGEANANWWLYLLSQTDFYETFMNRYYSVFSNSQIYEKLAEFIRYETSAFVNDFANDTERWKNGQNKSRMQTRQYSNQKSAADYLLDWLGKRKTYMDSVYLK